MSSAHAVSAAQTISASVPAVNGAPSTAASAAPVPTLYQPGVIAPQVQHSYLPYAQSYGYSHAAPFPVVQSVKAAPSRPVAPVTPAYYGAATYTATKEPVHTISEFAASNIDLKTVDEDPFKNIQEVSAPTKNCYHYM